MVSVSDCFNLTTWSPRRDGNKFFRKQSPSSTYLSHFVLFVHNNKLLLFNYILQSLIFNPINTGFDFNYFIDLINTNLPITQNFNFSKFSLHLSCTKRLSALPLAFSDDHFILPVTKLTINQWYVLLYIVVFSST